MDNKTQENVSEVEEVVDVAEAEIENAAPEDEKLEMSPEDGIQQLKKQLAYEQQARAEAERSARQANSQVRKAYGEVEDTNYQLVVNAIDTVRGRSEALKAAYRDAMSVGDYDKVAELQEAMSINAVQHSELEKGRSAMESRLRQMQAEANAPQPRQSSDPVEELSANVLFLFLAKFRFRRVCLGHHAPDKAQKLMLDHKVEIVRTIIELVEFQMLQLGVPLIFVGLHEL